MDHPDRFDRQEWTVAETARIPEDLRYELIDGQLLAWPPATFADLVDEDLIIALSAHCPPGICAYAVPHLAGETDATPDIVVIEQSRLDHLGWSLRDALLGVDVVGSDRRPEPRGYGKDGLRRYWVVDPFDAAGVRVTEHWLSGDGGCAEVRRTHDVFVAEDPYPVTLDLPHFTAVRWRAVIEAEQRPARREG